MTDQIKRPEIQPMKGSEKIYKPSDLNPALAHEATVQKFMEKMNLAVLSRKQIAIVEGCRTFTEIGLDLSGLTNFCDGYSRGSTAEDGFGVTHTVQVLTAPQIAIPGVGRLPLEDRPGLIDRIMGWFRPQSRSDKINQGGQS